MDIPRLVIAAPTSGSGKTTIATGLIAAFVARGLRVTPFKVGPDYIDPTYHTLAAGRASRNLDAWMIPPERVGAIFEHSARDSDLALDEGVMGLFDGYSGRDDAGSTAHIARLLDAPVLLVLDASAMARSAAAVVLGMRDFDPRVRLAGVLLNRVGSKGHAHMATEAIESEVGVPVVGYLTRDDTLNLPERHLGLIPTLEPGRWLAWLEKTRETITATVDLARVFDLARAAPELLISSSDPFAGNSDAGHATIAVARDAAFNFTYEDNLDLLGAAGAKIVFFSPLSDQALPPGTQALYLCGGFPEIYAAQLAANSDMRASIRAAFHTGLPIYAECGGLMYLTEHIVDQQKMAFSMVGLLPGHSIMSGRLTLGYRTARAVRHNWLWRAGETIRGHEFHYSTWGKCPDDWAPAYELLPNESEQEIHLEGTQVGNLIASYVHLHFLAHPDLATRFVAAASATKPMIGDV